MRKPMKLSDQLREIARIGIVNFKEDVPVLKEAARRIDELEQKVDDLEERIAIMQADMMQVNMDEIRFP